jgi:hypothetical protein
MFMSGNPQYIYTRYLFERSTNNFQSYKNSNLILIKKLSYIGLTNFNVSFMLQTHSGVATAGHLGQMPQLKL